jgi:arylsulfatase A-like enzyme
MTCRAVLPATLLFLLCLSCQPSGQRSPSLVLLISFDTLRADTLGHPIGPDRSLTPHLDDFSRDAVVFTKAFAQAPHTLMSHMSLWTGVYPDAHGVTHLANTSLPETFTTLPALFEHAGYRTAAFVTSLWLKPDFGFARSFDVYDVLASGLTYSERVNSAALRHLDSYHQGEDRLFLFLHDYEAHSDSHNEGTTLPYYAQPDVLEELRTTHEDGNRRFCDEAGRCAAEFLMYSSEKIFSAAEISAIQELYHAGVRHLDSETGRLFKEMKDRGIYDDALIVVTSDHGEEFREHGRFIHSQPYDETLAVPLLIKFPSRWKAGTSIDQVVELVDVMPTLAELLGVSVPEYVQGESLMPLVRGRHESPNGQYSKTAAISRGTIETSRHALRTDEYKLIFNILRSDTELYDLKADPGEQNNVAEQMPRRTERLKAQLLRAIIDNRTLGARMANTTASGESLLTETERRSLEALGYVFAEEP